MISVTRHGDVTRLRMASWRSRLVGYDVSAYLVRGILVDTGFPSIGPELEGALDALRPEGALVTHEHEDHAGNVRRLARRGLPVGAAPETVAALRRTLRPIELYRRFTWGSTPPCGDAPLAPFEHDALRLVPTPGHSPDHHVVWDAERGTIYGGDLFLGVKVRVAHQGEEPRRLVASLRAVAALAPERYFDAHRGLVATPAALLAAKADWLEETIAAVDRRAAAGWSDDAIRREVLGSEGLVGYVSMGRYSKIAFVRAVRGGTDITAGQG